MENPTHLTCPFCPAQAFPNDPGGLWHGLVRYGCPAKHQFYIIAEDTSFNFGHNLTTETT